MDISHTVGMDGTYSTYVDDERFDIQCYDGDIAHDIDDDAGDETDDDINGGGRGNLYIIKVPSCCRLF